MAIDREYPRYPNYDFLQLEEINQVIYNQSRKPIYQWYCFNLKEITDKYPSIGTATKINKSFYKLRYDFCIIGCNVSNNHYTYTFEIRNTFWTGKYKLTTLDGKTIARDKYTAMPLESKNGNTLMIETDLPIFQLCVELSNEDKARVIEKNNVAIPVVSIRFEGTYSYTHQCDKDSYETVRVIETQTNNPVSGATVKLVPLTKTKGYIAPSLETKPEYGYLKSYTTTTDSKGYAKIKLSATKSPATYYARLEATKGESSCHTSLTDTRLQNYTRNIEKQFNEYAMYKGEIRTFTFKVKPVNKYGVGYTPKSEKYYVDIYHTYDSAQNVPLAKSNAQKKVTKKYSTQTDENGTFEVTLNSREFYGNYSYIKITLPATTKFESYSTETISIRHDWRYAKDFADLKTEIERTNGADAIVLKNADYNRDKTETINVNRKQYILGQKGKNYPTINSYNDEPLFVLKAGSNSNKELMNMLVLNGIKVNKAKTVISQEGNSYVQLLNCVFTENQGADSEGAVIYQKESTCIADVHDNYFYNNYGNCITGRGNVRIDKNLFKVTAIKYTVQPEPIVLNQYTGTGVLSNNQIYVNTGIDYSSGKAVVKASPTNKSYAKISVWVGKKATVNGKGISELHKDNSFNYFDSPYNNKAYIFAVYYYPHGINAYIVAYATGKRINKATGHAVQGTDWAYRDGYNLVRVSSKNYSTKNPFVTIKKGKVIESPEIYVPTSGGVI